jgi:hypothetical protein
MCSPPRYRPQIWPVAAPVIRPPPHKSQVGTHNAEQWKRFHCRKNALFYRTLNGAQVGDLFISLIHTCQLCNANSFDYLTELQRHALELEAGPAEWMPWNYRETLAKLQTTG